MSERLPRNTHPAELARLAAARAAGARAVAAIALPAAPTVAGRAAKLSVVKPPVERGPRGRLGPSGGGPSIEEVAARVDHVEGRCPVGKKSKGGGPGLFGDEPGLDAYGKPAARTPMDQAEDYAACGAEAMERVRAIEASRERIRGQVAEIASEVMAPERRKLERYETVIERAIAELDGSPDPPAKMALAILRESLLPEGVAVETPATAGEG